MSQGQLTANTLSPDVLSMFLEDFHRPLHSIMNL